jgi:flagellar basal-body rod protein FlgB
MNILFDATLQGLAQALGIHQRRHDVLASNLANIDTPGFRAQELDFKAALRDAFEKPTSGTEGPALTPKMVEDTGAPARADGNTVDLDLQMGKLAANSERYLALARILGRRVALLRSAIEETR